MCAPDASTGFLQTLLQSTDNSARTTVRRPGVAQEAAEVLAARYPGLTVAGTYAGSPAPEEEAGISGSRSCTNIQTGVFAYEDI